MKTLEDKVAQLERRLSSSSPTQSHDHLLNQHAVLEGTQPETNPIMSSKLVHGVGFLSLCATAEPHYFGPSSGVSLAQLMETAVYEKLQPLSMSGLPSPEDRPFASHSPTARTRMAPLPSLEKGAQFIEEYLERIHTNFPFLSKRYLWDIHSNSQYLESSRTPDAEMDCITLQLVYAIGSRCLQLRGHTSVTGTSPEKHYVSAMAKVGNKLTVASIRNIQVTLLVALYAMRSPSGIVISPSF